ncbi:hypothetical protein XGA_0776 [Xanthomonas hortorum ATCC 19865]|nr:hypothetical protein XGA_0776 [Xanthomonas hortorum ATCC 19865]
MTGWTVDFFRMATVELNILNINKILARLLKCNFMLPFWMA